MGDANINVISSISGFILSKLNLNLELINPFSVHARSTLRMHFINIHWLPSVAVFILIIYV
jgi:hypothetical protein